MVVVVAPCRDQVAGVAQAGEQVLVQAFIPQTTVEALDEAVLHRFAGRDVVPFDLPVLLPCQDRIRGQLRAIVTDHHAGIAPQLGDPVEFPCHMMARDRCVDDGTQALPAAVVDDAQDPELTTPGQASPRTNAGSDPAGSPSACGFRVPACGRHACAPSAALRDKSGRASSSSLPSPLAQGGCAGGDSQTGDVRTTTRAIGFVARYRQDGWIGNDGRVDRSPPGGRRGAANSPSRSWPRSRQISLNWASEVFSEHLAQGSDVHHLLGQQTLQLHVLILKLLQPLGLADLHAAILRAPVVERRITDPVVRYD